MLAGPQERTSEEFLGAAPVAADTEALIEEARERQRRRRRLLAALVVLAAAGSGALLLALFGGMSKSGDLRPSEPRDAGRRVGVTTALRVHQQGFGTPLPTTIDSGPCPQGRGRISIRSAAGAPIGVAIQCVLTIAKLDVPGWGLRRIVQTVSERDALPGGALSTRQQQTFLFARDQKHTNAIFNGRITGGSGRYAGAHGTVTGGGPGLIGTANWTVTFHLR